MRRHAPCVDCGFVLGYFLDEVDQNKGFDCPRCKCHYSYNDFWDEQEFKYSYKAELEKEDI